VIFPLIQGFYQSRSIIANAQRCVNLYTEANTTTNEQAPSFKVPDAIFPYTFYPRPGYSTLYAMGSAAGAARCNYTASNGDLYRVVGDTVYYVDSTWTHTVLGTIGAGTSEVCMADNGLAVLIVDGTANGYAIDLTTHAFGTVNDPAFYGATRVDYADTYFALNRPNTNQFYISLSEVSYDNLTGTISPGQLYAAFDPLDIAAKAGWPDDIAGIIFLRRELWLIGQKTTEVWFNSGDPTFTYQEIPNAFIEHGCIAPYSIWKEDVSTYWLSQDKEGRAIVIEGMQYQARRISTHAIENVFATYSTLSDAVGSIYQVEGHVFYKLTFPTANATWVYDIATGFWFEDVFTDTNGGENRSKGIYAANAYQTNIESDWATGDLLKIDLASYVDVDHAIVRRRGFPHFMSDGGRVSYPSFIADISVGESTNQLLSVDLRAGGSGYTSSPSVTAVGGGGTGAVLQANVTLAIQSITVTEGGQNYTSAPNVSFISQTGSGATATSAISSAVTGLTLTAGGSDYTNIPTVAITGGGGTGATATAAIAQYVGSIATTAGGSGYSTAPAVTLTGGGGTGATATCVLSGGAVSAVTLTAPGTGYSSAPTVSFSGGGGSGATATANLSGGEVSGVSVSAGGSYLNVPTVGFSGGSASGAVATATANGVVYSITVTDGGSGYNLGAKVEISGGGGSGAKAIATVSGEVVTGIVLTAAGAGYISAPTITIINIDGGAGATATAIVGYSVTAVVVTNPGTGYTSAPTVSFTGTGVGGASATATVNATQVSSITVTAGGSGYTAAPTVAFSGGSGSGAAATAAISASVGAITVTAGGENFTGSPTVSFSGGGGSGAVGTPAMVGTVASLTLTDPGSGYTSAPTVTITGGGGTGATATASYADRVVSVTLTKAGVNYQTPPQVVFSGGGGSGAAAVANLSGPVTSVSVVYGGYKFTSVPTLAFSGGGGSGATAIATIGPIDPRINLRWSDTRGQSWGNPLTQSMGAAGYYTQPQWNRLGYARDRVFEVFWSSPTSTALNGAWVEAIPFGS